MNPLKRCGWLDSIAIFITLVSQQSTIRKRCLNPPTFVDRPLIRSRIDINPIRFTHPPCAAHEHTGKPLLTTRLTATEGADILICLARQEPKVRTRLKNPRLLITPRRTPCRARAETRHVKLIQGNALGRTVITHRCENRFKFPPLMPCHGLPRNSYVLRGQAQRKIKGIRRVLRQLGAIATIFIVMRKFWFQRHARCQKPREFDFLAKKFRLKPAVNRAALRFIERVKSIGVKPKGRKRNRERAILIAYRMRGRRTHAAMTSTRNPERMPLFEWRRAIQLDHSRRRLISPQQCRRR